MQTPDASAQTLLGSPDPVERRLVLKTRGGDPALLRQALADEDPEVRTAAARHPALTPELIRETLAGPDRWLASEVLRRPDLEPEDLAVALSQEDLRTQALEHPRLTPEHRERLAGDPGVPEGLREAALRKNIGHITYPQLGEGHVHNAGVYYPERSFARYWNFATRGDTLSGGTAAAVIHNQGVDTPLDPDERRMTLIARPQVDPAGVHEEVRHRTFGALPGSAVGTPAEYSRQVTAARDQRQPTLAIMGGKVHLGTEGHEVQHGVFARLGQRYGREARVAITQATMRRLPNDLRGHAGKLFGSFKRGYPQPEDHAEEAIAFLQNYLQDPLHRQKVHVHLRIAKDPDAQRESMQKARRTWQALQRVGQNLRPEDVGLPAPAPESERIAAWRKRLQKSREPGLDQLGYSADLEAVETALRFLTGKPVDRQVLRARLIDSDGDLVSAGLDAAGLSPDSRPALESLLRLRALGKSANESAKKSVVQPLSPSADDWAADLQQAFRDGQTEDVQLGGKHSKGTLLARDRDGNLLLVKPGSGKQSPAAGADENPATQSRREAGFSALARAWGLGDRVPRAELVAVDGRETAAIDMLGTDWSGLARAAVQNAGLPRQVLRRYLDAGELHAWAILDYVAGNPDRHGNNILVSPEVKGSREVGLIDHGSAFAGPSFSPGRDRNSFVPYYLRIWGPDRGWSRLTAEQRLAALPSLSREADDRLRTWIEGLTDETLAGVLHGHGIDPQPSLRRLHGLRDRCATADNCSRVVNGLWLA